MKVTVGKEHNPEVGKTEFWLKVDFQDPAEQGIVLSVFPEIERENKFNLFFAICRRLFEEHESFYRALGMREEEYRRYNPTSDTFHSGSHGFYNFILGADSQMLMRIASAIAQRMALVLQEQESGNVASANVVVLPRATQIALNDVKFTCNPLLFTDDGAYILQLRKVDAKSPENLVNEAIAKIKKMYDMELEAKIKALNRRIEIIKRKYEGEKAKLVANALVIAMDLIDQGWKYVNGRFIYDKTIMAKKFVKDGVIYDIPGDFNIYVEKLIVPLQNNVYDVYCKDAYHPNVNFNESKRVCIGDLEGKPLHIVLRKLPKLLEVANLDSAYDNDATYDLKKYWEDHEEIDNTGELIWET